MLVSALQPFSPSKRSQIGTPSFFREMQRTLDPQEEEEECSHSVPTSNSYGAFDGTYSSDFENMLAAHNASSGYSLSPSTTLTDNISPAETNAHAAYHDYEGHPNRSTRFANENFINEQFQSMISLNGTGAFDFGFSDLAPRSTQNAGLQAHQQQPHQSDHSMPILTSVEDSCHQSHQYKSSSGALSSPVAMTSDSSGHFISPIVRVEKYQEDDASSAKSQEPQLSRQSTAHLSPYPTNDYVSDEEGLDVDDLSCHVHLRHSVEREGDGSWLAGASGLKGLSPSARDMMKDQLVPSSNDIEKERKLKGKNAEVVDWLTHSEVGSDNGKFGTSITQRRLVNRRRAKSTNDLSVYHEPDDSSIPGPGAYLNVPSDYEEEDDAVSSGDGLDSPPADISTDNVDSYFVSQSDASLDSGPIPWVDPPTRENTRDKPYQPPTANAAMMRFRQRAKDVESASLAATLGSSRRRSESDMGSILTVKAISKEIGEQPREKGNRMGTILGKITPRRNNSNSRKRKVTGTGSQSQLNLAHGASGDSTPREQQEIHRMGSWGRPKSPKPDTSSDAINPLPMTGSALAAPSSSTPWGMAKQVIRRSRSRSDVGRSRSKSDAGRSPGLGELMTNLGGPPMPKLASPSANAQDSGDIALQDTPIDIDDDAIDETGLLQGGVVMDLAIRPDPIIPTHAGFLSQARFLNPRTSEYLLDRVTQEQIKRYQRLLHFRSKHATAVKAGKCESKSFCFELGGQSKLLKHRAGKDTISTFVGFQIIRPGVSAEKIEKESDGTIVTAQFPSGVPLPPVERLPAEFECPLCFKVKKFQKPSDWTKHVHEDVQPFTCTFADCSEPKSFKRKADWVRHENERHRQLEKWTCDMGDCTHVCFRKDNFVQHLVREHKLPEPKARTGKADSKSPNTPLDPRSWPDPFSAFSDIPSFGTEDIWPIVDRCRRDTFKQPQEEPCKFCGNICNTWKKLTVHVAKHMEQISMPVLPLVNARLMDGASSVIPSGPPPSQPPVEAVLSASPQDLPTFLTHEPLPPDINSSMVSPLPPDIAVNGSQVMHTYPPFHLWNVHYQMSTQQTSPSESVRPDVNITSHAYACPLSLSRQPSPSGASSYSSSDLNAGVPAPHTSAPAGHEQQQQQQQQQMFGTFRQQQLPPPMYTNTSTPSDVQEYGNDTLGAAYMMSAAQGDSGNGHQFGGQDYGYYGSSAG